MTAEKVSTCAASDQAVREFASGALRSNTVFSIEWLANARQGSAFGMSAVHVIDRVKKGTER